jgi:hypothetical protein
MKNLMVESKPEKAATARSDHRTIIDYPSDRGRYRGIEEEVQQDQRNPARDLLNNYFRTMPLKKLSCVALSVPHVVARNPAVH